MAMPNQRLPRCVWFGVLLTTMAATVIVLTPIRQPSGDLDVRRTEFQTLVGGLGFGATVDLAHCAFSFDPRLQSSCDRLEGPLAGGYFLCPNHVGRAIGYPALDPTDFHISAAAGEGDHATMR